MVEIDIIVYLVSRVKVAEVGKVQYVLCIVVGLEETLESPLDCKIKPIRSEGY